MDQQIPGQFSVLVVDDHELVRSGMRLLLESIDRVHTIAEASCGEDALRLTARTSFDLILMDVDLPGMGGLEATLELRARHPETQIIIISALLNPPLVRKFLKAGVSGYLTKGSSGFEMEKAIEAVVGGQSYFSSAVSHSISSSVAPEHQNDPFAILSGREREIVNQILEGERNIEIGASLGISEKTVSTYRKRAFEKLGLKNSTELVRLAVKHGLWSDA